MTEETENTEKAKVKGKYGKYRPSKERLQTITKEEAEKEEKVKDRLIRRAELIEKEKETGITILPEEEEEEEEKEEKKGKPPKGKIAGTIFDKRFPPLEDSAGHCTESEKEVISRYNKETKIWEQFIGNVKVKREKID